MRARTQLLQWWRRWWLAPQPLEPLALFRIVISLAMMQQGVILWSNAPDFLGPQAFVSPLAALIWHGWPELNLFYFLPVDLPVIYGLLAVYLFFSCCLCVGAFSRLSSIVVYVCLASLMARNPFIAHSGHELLRLFAFYLMFSPCGRALSFDAWYSKRHRGIDLSKLPRNGIVQRLIQLQVAYVYLDAFTSKVVGTDWLSGSAVGIVLQIDAFRFLPYPDWLANSVMTRAMTYFTLVAEFCMFTLVWWKPTRYISLAMGCFLHLMLFVFLNVPLFQFVMLAGYLVFLEPRDWQLKPNAKRSLQPA